MKDRPTPAFPIKATEDLTYTGMTLRDYFAAKAMQGMIIGTHMWAEREDADLAGCAYDLADAMLKARAE